MNEIRKQVAEVSIKAFDNGQLEINGPLDTMMTIHILCTAQRGLVESILQARQQQERSLIQKPGLRHVMELAKHQ